MTPDDNILEEMGKAQMDGCGNAVLLLIGLAVLVTLAVVFLFKYL